MSPQVLLVAAAGSWPLRQTPLSLTRWAGCSVAAHLGLRPGPSRAARGEAPRAFGPMDGPGPRVVEAVFFGTSAMKSRSWKLTCWFWLYRQTRGLRWFVTLVWPLHQLPRRLVIELELRRCERSWQRD